ncbi:amidase [Microvirga sp. BT689]|nr:amidase [Microvirga arvi]
MNAFVRGQRCLVAAIREGALSGLTFAVKDLLDVAGYATGAGNPDWSRTHPVPAQHAPVVSALLEDGASIIGKTMTDEISLGILGENGHFGMPMNPRAPDRVPGGSSSGSASVVAAGLCDFALGTDTGGSVRVPASFCGLYGIRPTHGLIGFEGIVSQAPSYDTVGWFARDARTFSRVGSVLLKELAEQRAPRRLVVAADAFGFAEKGVQDALESAVRTLEHCVGARTDEPIAPAGLNVWQGAQRVLQSSEAYAGLSRWLDTCNPLMSYSVARALLRASQFTDEERGRAALIRQEAMGRMRHLLQPGTIVCLPTTPFAAPLKDQPLSTLGYLRDQISCLTTPAGLSGVPQVNIPWSMPDGTPIGLSIIGPWRSDRMLLTIAEAFEAATSKNGQRK